MTNQQVQKKAPAAKKSLSQSQRNPLPNPEYLAKLPQPLEVQLQPPRGTSQWATVEPYEDDDDEQTTMVVPSMSMGNDYGARSPVILMINRKNLPIIGWHLSMPSSGCS